jgi:hypothetical protein
MKPAPSKHSILKMTNNQNTAICYSEKQEQRQQAIQLAEQAKEMPHLKNKPIKFDINRKP